jgi:hypothetical protein
VTRYASEDGYDHAAAELADRRQRAREAGLDAWADVCAVPSSEDRAENALNDAIEVATRVRVDDDIIDAAQQAFPIFTSADEARPVLTAAFRAAGFEVVE